MFADSPTASRLENGVRAIFAEEEGRAISERTKAALAAAKANGTKLGNYDGGRALKRYIAEHGNDAGIEGAKRQADEFVRETRDFIAPLVKQDMTDKEIAAALNEQGIKSRRGGSWHETSVRRFRLRMENLKQRGE